MELTEIVMNPVRHIKILTDSTILMVVGEKRIRGTVESVYQLYEGLKFLEKN